MLRMRQIYAETLYKDAGATLDDPEAVAELEDPEPNRAARAVARARRSGD